MKFNLRLISFSHKKTRILLTIAEVIRVAYKLSCSGWTSTYVGQTVRHLTASIEELKKSDSSVGLHFQQCSLEGIPQIILGKL